MRYMCSQWELTILQSTREDRLKISWNIYYYLFQSNTFLPCSPFTTIDTMKTESELGRGN